MGATMGKSSGTFLDGLPSQGTLHVVMLGLDSAGKTTALYRLKFDQYLNTVPTIGFNCEKVQGTVGKAKGVQFLVWDVGGQEKLRPLWRSYTRCTDGILFVVDSVDVERMEEAKMELMRTAKCPDNQGVPVLILANKQDLPGARDAKELEKLLGLHELIYPVINLTSMSSSSSSTGNIVGCSTSNTNSAIKSTCRRSLTPTSQHNNSFDYSTKSSITKDLSIQFPALLAASTQTCSKTSLMDSQQQNTQIDLSVTKFTDRGIESNEISNQDQKVLVKNFGSSPPSTATTPTVAPNNSFLTKKCLSTGGSNVQYKGWFIQPACAITGEGLQEGLEALYEMILKRRKLNKAYRKKR